MTLLALFQYLQINLLKRKLKNEKYSLDRNSWVLGIILVYLL